MAEGFLKSFDPELIVYSAGTNPSSLVHPLAIKVMAEAGIDISEYYTKNVNQLLHKSFDYVITVCDNAKNECPVFIGNVKNRLHIGFEDPASAEGTEKEILFVFRSVRDDIKQEFYNFYTSEIKGKEKSVV
jgi:arsenate reductase (thioredoxin)